MKREPNERATHHFLTVRQAIRNFRATIVVLTLSLLFMQGQAQAQSPTPLEQQCMNAVQGKVAWNQAGSTTWGADNLRNLCQGTTNPTATITCFQGQIKAHNSWERGIAECKSKPSSTGELVRASYDSNPFVADSTKAGEWRWNGGNPFTRTIYNPLDGGVLLKYKQSGQGNSDGCSGPDNPVYKAFFQQACFAHDVNYDAPFGLAGFPNYATGDSIGKDLADYLFKKDMLMLSKQNSTAVSKSIDETSAAFFFRAVQDFGGYRGRPDGKEILEKGGVIAVKNNGGYVMGLKVKWTDAQGVQRAEEIQNAGGRAATIPLSIGARNIEVECWAVAGKQIFKKSFSGVGMYAFTVGGTTLAPTLADGLNKDAGDEIKTIVTGEKIPAGERGIIFNNQAGYVAKMTVVYFMTETVGGAQVPMAKSLSTPAISLGFSRPLVIPRNTAKGMPISVVIEGIGTIKGKVLETTVAENFTGNVCFKSWGTIFDAKGGPCQ
jgi:hypothetical protein